MLSCVFGEASDETRRQLGLPDPLKARMTSTLYGRCIFNPEINLRRTKQWRASVNDSRGLLSCASVRCSISTKQTPASSKNEPGGLQVTTAWCGNPSSFVHDEPSMPINSNYAASKRCIPYIVRRMTIYLTCRSLVTSPLRTNPAECMTQETSFSLLPTTTTQRHSWGETQRSRCLLQCGL